MAQEKKLILSNLERLDSYFFDKTVADILSDLNSLVKKYEAQGFEHLFVTQDSGYDGLEGFELAGHRLETEEEFQNRLIKEAKQKLANEKRKEKKKLGKLTKQEKEYQTYLELKEKFEAGK